ncbi:MAG: sulfatase [Roseivirga sp.]|nr:sulfatase [Roseivirga sp.]
MKRLTVLILLVVFAVSCDDSGTQKSDKPNIVIIFCDDLGYGDLTSYGHPTIRTPNLDRMVAEGMKFTNFYSGSPACTASRYSLLTGRYPIRSGFGWVLVPSSPRGMHPEEIPMAEGMKQAGYSTAMFGKWHLGVTKTEYLPLQNGFDEFLGLPYSNDMIPPKWKDIPLIDGNDTLEHNPDQTKLTKMYTDRAVDFIQRKKDEPFLLYVPYAMPHVPLMPGSEFNDSERGKYGDVVEEIDWGVGEIMKTLKAQGIAENTLVFFTSDNGPWIIKDERGGSSGLLRDGKGSTWEGGMRVPGIAWWPGTIKAGTIQTQRASTLDLYQTAFSLTGQYAPEDRPVDGRDISSLLQDQAMEEGEPYFYYGLNNRLMAVRKGAWKLHITTHSQTGKDYFEGKLPLLFNLSIDPSEKYEISDDNPEIVAELQGYIEAHQKQLENEPTFFDQ